MPDSGQLVITYTTQVVTSLPSLVTTYLQVDAGSQGVYTRTQTLLINPIPTYLPLVLRRR